MRETVREYFDRTAQTFASNYSVAPDFQERLKVWERVIGKYTAELPDGSVCLDVGCGDGSIGRRAACRGIQTIGFDQSESMLELARQRAVSSGLDLRTEYVRSSIPLGKELAKIYENVAGLVICSSVLEYIGDYLEALRQLHAFLKPGGILLLSLPNRSSVYRTFERAVRRHLVRQDSYLRYQLHQFDSHRMSDQMAIMGFKIIGEEFFALPLQTFTEKFFGSYRSRWLATMFMVAAQKR